MEENKDEPQTTTENPSQETSENPPQQDDKSQELIQHLEQSSNSPGHDFKPLENDVQNVEKVTRKGPIKKTLSVIATILGILLLISGAVVAFVAFNLFFGGPTYYKPIIYLYPTKTQNIKVELNLNGKLTSTYPDYDETIKGWEVNAKPDGSLINLKDGKEYSYLFWEGLTDSDYSNLDTGFVIKGSDTKDFLQSTLSKLGLTAKEYNEMIVYWLPKMENNKYNLIHFAGKEYTDNAKLTITPAPDSMLRVFMVFKPLDKFQQISPQQLDTFERKGFAVVEWGGTEIE
jgi:hypothetical protein